MTNVDVYQQCPCGSGKKLKFCCGTDISHELEAIQRALDGDQKLSALDLVGKAIATKGPRPALVVAQFEIGLMNAKTDVALAAALELSRQRPKDPTPAAMRSLVSAIQGEVKAAIDLLQDSLEVVSEGQPPPIHAARSAHQIGMLRCERRSFFDGLTYLAAASQMMGHQDSELASTVQQLSASRDVPLIAKEVPRHREAPATAPWKASFDAATRSFYRGRWRKARGDLRLLAEQYSQEPIILRSLAVAQSLLGDPKASAAAWRVYSRLPQLPLEDAVEAELLAEQLDPGQSPMLDVVLAVYPIRDVEPCMEQLLSDHRCFNVPFDSRDWDAEDGPPPKAIFLLLDPPLLTTATDLEPAQASRLQGSMSVFGKQTDRPARLEFEYTRDAQAEQRLRVLQDVAGRFLDPPTSDNVVGQRDARGHALTVGVVLPREMPAKRQQEISGELRRQALTETWVNIPLWECGNKTAKEASQDPRLRIPLLAAILDMELALQQQGADFDANALRDQLGLPQLEPISVTDPELASQIPLVRLARLKVDALSNECLERVLPRAMNRGFRLAQRRLALAATERGETSPDLALTGCEVLATTVGDYNECFEWIQKGRQLATRHGVSVGRLKVLELEIRFLRNEFDQGAAIVQDLIRNEAAKDENVAMLLFATMSRLGLVTPEGKFVLPRSRAPQAASPLAGGSTTAGGIWTPGATSSAAVPAPPAPDSGKSKLWVPGMD